MSHSIRFAQRSEKDMSALASLWKNAFGDGDEFIGGFIKDYLVPQYNVPVVECDGEIASALYMLEFPLFSQTRHIGRAAYLFAAATDTKYRNLGYMSELINYSLELYRNRGCSAVFLIPGDDSLSDYYSRFGFIPVFTAAKQNFSGAEVSNTGGHTLVRADLSDSEIFDRVYELYSASAIKYPLAPLKDENYFRRAAESYLGEAHFGQITADNKIFCYIFYRIGKNSIFVDDIILEESIICGWNGICGIIASATAVSLDFKGEIIITAPPFNGVESSRHGMICPLTDETKDICNNIALKKSPNYINMFMNY